MPANRLPWVKVWIEAIDHEKFAALTDAERWTWVVLLAKASQQPRRWRYASVEHARLVSGRPAAHIKKLMAVRLIDECSEGLLIHDAKGWQEAANMSSTTREHTANGDATLTDPPPNGGGTVAEGWQNDDNAVVLEGEGERDRERDRDIPPRPSLRSGPAPRGNRRVQGVIDAFRERGEPEPRLSQRDVAALKRSTAEPAEIVDAYLAVRDGEWGDPWMLKRLNLFEAVGWVNGYLASQPRAPAPPTSLSVVPSDGHANAFCQPCSDAGRRPHPPGHPGCVATAFRESA